MGVFDPRVERKSELFRNAACLAMFVLNEKRKNTKNSRWGPWLSQLSPTQPSASALYMTEEQQGMLAGCTQAQDLVQEYAEGFRNLNRQREELCARHPHVFPPKYYTSKRFRWAFSTVLSRSFPEAAGTVTEDPSLIPYIDYCNMSDRIDSSETNAAIFKDAEGTFQLRCMTGIDVGGEARIVYGSLSNEELLCRYGYVPHSDNPFAKVQFKLRLKSGVLHPELQRQFVDADEYERKRAARDAAQDEEDLDEEEEDEEEEDPEEEDDGVPVRHLDDGRVEIAVDFTPSPSPLPANMLEILRSLVLAKHAREGIEVVSGKYTPEDPLPVEYEEMVFSKLLQMLQGRLESYPTTLEDDMNFSSSVEIDPEERDNVKEDPLRSILKPFSPDTKDADDIIGRRKAHHTEVYVNRLRLQEKMILVHHHEEVGQALLALREQKDRRKRILDRSKAGSR